MPFTRCASSPAVPGSSGSRGRLLPGCSGLAAPSGCADRPGTSSTSCPAAGPPPDRAPAPAASQRGAAAATLRARPAEGSARSLARRPPPAAAGRLPPHSRVPHVDARHHLVAVRAREAVAAAPVSQKVVQLLHRDAVVGHGAAPAGQPGGPSAQRLRPGPRRPRLAAAAASWAEPRQLVPPATPGGARGGAGRSGAERGARGSCGLRGRAEPRGAGDGRGRPHPEAAAGRRQRRGQVQVRAARARRSGRGLRSGLSSRFLSP